MVIPEKMHPIMLQRTRQSHQGPEACVRCARDVIFWPGMASENRQLANQCATCNSHVAKQQKEPLMLPEIPNTPWTIVAQDLFTCVGRSYLIMVSSFGNWTQLQTHQVIAL